MADLTITVAVTTGTQYVTGSTSNIFTFDGSQPTDFTFPWVEDGTVRLEQSGSSNDGHPLIFSTSNSTVLSTMQAGIISSGVTYYLDGSSTESDYTNTTTFNAATTRYIEITPAAATDFYFACWVHGIGMGGIVDITQTTWGALGYGYPSWGGITASLTGLEMTAGLGAEGWGRSTWGNDAWGEESIVNIEIGEPLTGFSITGSLGTPTINYDFIFTLSESLLGTLSLGTPTITDTVIGVSGYAITASLGTVTEEVITFPTGYSATMSLGTLTVTSNPLVPVSGFAITGSLGSLGAIDDMQIGVSGYAITGSLGTLTVTDMAIGVSGFEISGTLGSGGVSPLYYKDVDITGNTSYTDIEHSA